jgi:AhpD family alkylhydroperoxidase
MPLTAGRSPDRAGFPCAPSKALDAKTRAGIGLAVAEANGCSHCLAVHRFAAKHVAKLPADEIILARLGHASDPRRDAAIQFARRIIETRGEVSDGDLRAVRDAGYTAANLEEIAALVAMYS